MTSFRNLVQTETAFLKASVSKYGVLPGSDITNLDASIDPRLHDVYGIFVNSEPYHYRFHDPTK